MSKACLTCRWGVIGPYSKIYKGCPVGCKSPQDNRHLKTKGGFKQGCWEPKEDKNGKDNSIRF